MTRCPRTRKHSTSRSARSRRDVWMVASVIVIASFTAALSSQLTLKQLRGTVHGETDLRYVRVAAIAGTETSEYLSHQHIACQVFADVDAGLSALQKRRIDALVYDRPLLLWQISEHHSESLQVLDATFDPQVWPSTMFSCSPQTARPQRYPRWHG